ncbi:Lrp/AsnC family transcriptional regulator [Congregibacter litoralis]|uniref:Transcriptional regulator, AsnC family n=1 Tax=Congregibacter litoralis KT71 TaxID=314285 RepID=A4ACB2_9GAMM|nr:Lrp/AsnC family transcriptional regulator [Congregibacter litoralis]EAQ96340.1 transcriptional regulator, AsnC family [Congregibacter litoralis KT71]
MSKKLDKTERRILEVLQQDGRTSNVELAQAVGLSESPCLRRVRGLEEQGVIAGYSATLNQRSLGLQVTAFVQVQLEKHDDQKTQDFLVQVAREEHIIECHAMSGAYDYLLKVVAQSMDHFSEIAMQGILQFPGVKGIESSFSLLTVKQAAPLPIGD